MKGVISMSGRKMYSTKFKLEVVQRYLKGDIGLNSLAREYHISSKACIQKWLALYREHGVSGLCTTSGTYSGDFKIAVVEYMHNTGASLRLTFLPKNQWRNGNVSIMRKVKMPCMRKEEEGHLKWEANEHLRLRKIRIKTKICLQKCNGFGWRTNI